MHRVTAVVVNWNSGDDLARLIGDLRAQRGVDVSIVVVDNASSDDSVAKAQAVAEFHLVDAGANLGYTGGNRVGAEAAGPDADLFIVNPDVSLPDPTTLEALCLALESDPRVAAVAPLIEIAPGQVEYLNSVIDLDRAAAIHTDTHVAMPPPGPPVDLSWIDGCAWLLRADARAEVGMLDDRYFLLFEEVEWCIRASGAGWRVALVPTARVGHRRSSSFVGTDKSGYYYWRNLYLLCRTYARSRVRWRWHYLRRVVRHVSPVVLRGVLDAVRGRYGPGPEDATRQAA